MFIVVEHTITNPKAFWELPKTVQIPQWIKLFQSFPSLSGDRAVCLWETESVERLKDFLEPLTSPFSRNTYYGVDATRATGLPPMPMIETAA